MKISGRVWKLGDGISATSIVSAKYDKQAMSKQFDECARHILEDVDPAIAPAVQPGDFLVAGEGFGSGHAHYYVGAVMGSKTAGFGGFFAHSMNGLFQRAAIDSGMLAWTIPGLRGIVETGDMLEVDLDSGTAINLTTGATLSFPAVSHVISDIIEAGGSTPWALKRVGAEHAIA